MKVADFFRCNDNGKIWEMALILKKIYDHIEDAWKEEKEIIRMWDNDVNEENDNLAETVKITAEQEMMKEEAIKEYIEVTNATVDEMEFPDTQIFPCHTSSLRPSKLT